MTNQEKQQYVDFHCDRIGYKCGEAKPISLRLYDAIDYFQVKLHPPRYCTTNLCVQFTFVHLIEQRTLKNTAQVQALWITTSALNMMFRQTHVPAQSPLKHHCLHHHPWHCLPGTHHSPCKIKCFFVLNLPLTDGISCMFIPCLHRFVIVNAM